MTSPSPASVPTEEDVARVIRDEYGCAPACDYPVCIGGECGHECERDDRSVGAFRDAARAVLALFAPILAEKERANMRRWTAALSQAQDWRNVAEKAEARALAAEAALASAREEERERSAKVAQDYVNIGRPDEAAAAIRAQGE